MKPLRYLFLFSLLICLNSCQTNTESAKANNSKKTYSHQEKLQWLQQLEQRMIHKHSGGGEFTVSKASAGHEIYADSVKQAKKLAQKALKNYPNYKIELNDSGSVIKGNDWQKLNFDQLIEDFYGLGLALHFYPKQENQSKVRSFLKWLRWTDLKSSELDRKQEYYLGGLGRAFFLCNSVMDKQDRDFALDFLFGKVSDPGKAGVAKALYIAEHGPLDKEIGYRQNDVLRGRSESLLCAVFLLPDNTAEEKAHKLASFEMSHKALLLGLTPSKGVYGFLKPDFTASHHMYNYVSAYTPQGLSSLAAMASFMRNSPWQFSDDQLKYLRGAARELHFYAHHDSVPLGLTGRMFSNDMLAQSYSLLPLASIAGQEDDLALLQTFCNTYRKAIGTQYSPLSRLNQQGFPAYASAYAQTLDKVKKLQLKPKTFEKVSSYPYSPSMAMQKNNWTAFAKGMSKWWWSYEGGITASNPQAVYGIYKSHGSLEITYRNPVDPTGGKTLNPSIRKGMDMAHLPGITAPARSSDDMINDVIGSRLKINSTSVGGASLSDKFGLFMFDLKNTPKEMKDPGFTAKKSYFFLGDKIVLLGTGINSDSDKYPIHTTLFQNHLNQEEPEKSPIVDHLAQKITAVPYSNKLANSSTSLLIDADGTAYYLPAGQDIQLERKNVNWAPMSMLPKDRSKKGILVRQKAALALKKESSYRALAWIDHGHHPQNASYEYAVLPATNFTDLKEFQQKQDEKLIYEFKEKSAGAHILHDKENQLWAYALYNDFQAGDKGPLKQVNIHQALPHEHEKVDAHPGYAILIKDKFPKQMDLALSFLDLRLRQAYDTGLGIKKKGAIFYGSAPVIVKVLIQGKWSLDSVTADVTITHTEDKTQILIQCQDGLSRNLKLIQE
ncbi:polysaccharide lyase family 8 super-sandwich domain-containing protein [Lentisphaera profundi]|uniref:Polysaccharide lyase family 8 super-sandwich domain-containing protein n=1 Tax=Lentisphaera profundi TaxID=1658616 RepID=A0ABY7VT69_9BACT|nr:polysaccharide lyase family 8 super-sandwich domain-containing protein [Lentisphaera profundi]WDE97415.1 polysaccharide lyase family 8 super-sandwich domain-containing protein [Lentisphaera profundi]